MNSRCCCRRPIPSRPSRCAAASARSIRERTAVSLKIDIGVTLDFGVAVHPQDGDQKSDLMRMADERLYELKHSGRAPRVVPIETHPARESAPAPVAAVPPRTAAAPPTLRPRRPRLRPRFLPRSSKCSAKCPACRGCAACATASTSATVFPSAGRASSAFRAAKVGARVARRHEGARRADGCRPENRQGD